MTVATVWKNFIIIFFVPTGKEASQGSLFRSNVIYSYLYHKEHEVNRLTIAIECIRYGVVPDEAMHYIRNN